MTSTSSSILVSCLMAMMVLVIVAADDKTPSICNVGLTELAECLPAITGDKPSWPTKSCCKVMHKVNLPCLCDYKDKLLQYGISPQNAMALPKRCDLTLPVQCGGKY
ncbi:putative lipid-transfer protein DIR1 [Heracleum sosnowskyi]|uniref:Lipid-transfer protein DIR1 n=1 Tax=Heracleum sosnowskyi TaxID=360622 RepID=A0AAD8J6J8_9APIA|nr:putative lipid-transfer protein DIR1 [Heracleum sosnowskyi]